MSVRRRPHSFEVFTVSAPVNPATKQRGRETYAPAGMMSGMLVSQSPEEVMRRYGVASRQGYVLLINLEDAARVGLKDELRMGDRQFVVEAAPVPRDAGGGADHAELLLQERQVNRA